MTGKSAVAGKIFRRFTLAVILCIMASSAGINVIKIYRDFTVFRLGSFEGNPLHVPASNISAEGSNNSSSVKMLPNMLIDTTKFDRESCISRTESPNYRKHSPHTPSPYLISKVREYEQLHTKCGPNSESYKAAIKELDKYRNQTNFNSPCKYVIWTPAAGLGNRMLSLASAFLYGLLTDRVLLLYFNKDAMSRLYCEPFPNSTWLLPDDFRQIIQGDKKVTFEKLVDENSEPLIVQIGLARVNIENFRCDHGQERLDGVPVVTVTADRYFVPSLYMLSTFQEELSKLFLEKEAIFNLLGNYLFQPSNEAWKTIIASYQANLEQADQKVGLQIRVFNPQETTNKTVLSKILSCVGEHNLLPKIETNISTTEQRPVNRTAILVASLYPEYGESLKDMYGNIIEVYQPSHEENQKFNNQEHDLKAWVEIYLLSLCDVLVTSWGSTFGYVAHSLGGTTPWVLDNFSEAQNISTPSCRRELSMEPCSHYVPTFECGNNTASINITALFPYIRRCQDNRGLKLVSSVK